MQLLNLLLFWIFFGFLCSYLARKRGKNGFTWFLMGLFLGIFGVALILILPYLEAKRKPIQVVKPVLSPPPRPIEAHPKWFYLDAARQPQGPLGISELSQLWKVQTLSEGSYLWAEGMENWKKIQELPDVFDELKKALT